MIAVLRRTSIAILLSCALIASSALVARAAAGSLDAAFGSDGTITTNFTLHRDYGLGVAIQADGKIVVAGRAAGHGGMFALVRYKPNGHLDPIFGHDGRVTTNFTAKADTARALDLQANGKIVVAGGTGGAHGNFALARYKPNGHLDPIFGHDGRVTTNFTAKVDAARAVAIQANGKIVVAGAAGGADGKFALARYTASGALDHTFSLNGKATTNFTVGHSDAANAVAIQGDGKVVVAGVAGGKDSQFALARYMRNGKLDSAFGLNGKVRTNFAVGGADGANAVAIQADGKIVAAGFDSRSNGTRKFALARYNQDGSLDSTFESGDGMLDTSLTGNDVAFAVAIQANGKIVAAGGARGKFGVARYLPDGTRDTNFSHDGQVTTNFSAGADVARGMLIQSNGKIVCAGSADSLRVFAVARYLGS
jgi:uncharacterized delta-60 repeat protein